MTRTDALALAMAVLAGCETSAVPDAPRPTGMTPSIGFATAETIVEIRGEFPVKGIQSADEGGSRIDASYRAWLGATPLLDVTWIDTRTLRARVPAWLPVGTYDLTVEGPNGSGTLRSAFNMIADDPFGDGSPFAFVVEHGGEIYIGPNRTGIGIIRMQPDGTQQQSLALSFTKDVSGNQSSNTSTPPYTSIGYSGCRPNTSSGCGPDNEDGRGFFASATFAGEPWLVLGGARSGGDLDYVYMTTSTTSPLGFSYVDLSAVLGAATRGFSAALGASGGLFLGFPDNGGSRPYGIMLLHAPSGSGLDAVDLADVRDLNLHTAYDEKYVGGGSKETSFATISMVDAIAELGGRVYFFNDVGCLVSTSSSPAGKADFLACSPQLGAEYQPAQSIHPTKLYDLEPNERAWPAATVWNGRLYAIRNTSSGPQLWSCDPAGGDPAVCDRTDWRLVAAEGSRTLFGNPGATAATLLLATPTHLYVGLDDATTGVHVYRTGVPTPTVESEFSGKDGCVAGTAGCEGIGGDGFGLGAAVSRIFDAKAIAVGDSFELVIAGGNGADPVLIVRLVP